MQLGTLTFRKQKSKDSKTSKSYNRKRNLNSGSVSSRSITRREEQAVEKNALIFIKSMDEAEKIKGIIQSLDMMARAHRNTPHPFFAFKPKSICPSLNSHLTYLCPIYLRSCTNLCTAAILLHSCQQRNQPRTCRRSAALYLNGLLDTYRADITYYQDLVTQ